MNSHRPRTIAAVIAISFLISSASVIAQPDARVCRNPGLAFGGAEGTPVSVTDAMEVTEDVTIGALHVVVDISHSWVGDIELDLLSPLGTIVRLHDGAGGSSDDLNVVFSDNGVPNGSEPFSFGCYMQVSGNGGVGTLAEYAGEGSLGTWSLQILDTYPSSADGVLERWCLRFYEISPAAAPPPVESLGCATTSDGAVLTWVDPVVYDAVDVRLDNELAASLPGSATTFTIESKPPGTEITVDVEGIVDGSAPSCPVSCSFVPLGTPPEPLTEKLVLVVVDGLRYTEGLGDPLRQYVPQMDALAAQGTLIEPFLNDCCTVTRRGIPAIMSGSWAPPIDFFDTECQEDNQYTPLPWVHEYFRRQLARPAADCVYILGPYCPWRPSFLPTYGPDYWPQSVATSGDDDAAWVAAQSILGTQRPTFLTLYLSDVDHSGHAGDWTAYINAIEDADRIVGELWSWLQQDPEYSGSTTVLITNDHGRHTTDFSGHGDQCEGCRTIQLLALGPGIRAGYVSNVQRSIPDIAPTIAALLGFQTEFASGEIMTEILSYDCNGNGIQDECDIDCGPAAGPCDLPGCAQSADCNGNGVPDECDPEHSDIGLFVDQLLVESPDPVMVCMFDQNSDATLDGTDIQGFVDMLVSP